MNISRRGFLRSLGVGTATGIAVQWPLASTPRADRFEPSRSSREPGLILLYSNENAYGPSPKVIESIESSVNGVNRYPRMQYQALVELIAGLHHVKPDQVLLGCGSTEILRMAAFTFLGNGKQ